MGDSQSPTRIVWLAAGEPEPHDGDWKLIPPSSSGTCARCGTPDGRYSLNQLISSNFVPTRNSNRLHVFDGNGYCAACVFCARSLRLRCISWTASTLGVEFWRTRPEVIDGERPDALSAILSPPATPFVMGMPMYGIAHGGENHWQRTWWPGESRPSAPLKRLQAKHVALYARVASSRDIYPVQIDDDADIVVHRDVWLRARVHGIRAVKVATQEGVHDFHARHALRRLALPKGSNSSVSRAWPVLTAPLRQHVDARWWPYFCEMFSEGEAT